MYKESDTEENVVTFESSDSLSFDSWTDVDILESGETHKSIFHKLSTMVKNIRYLYKLLGTTDISSIDNGTVTGGLSYLNTETSTLKKSVADGKALVANAISGQGVSTAVDAAFATLAANVTSAGNGRYNSGYAQGVTDADNRENGNSINYQSGYNAGVVAADARANAYSYNYQVGTTNGLSQAAYGLYTNQGYAGCWIAVYYWNQEDRKIIEPSVVPSLNIPVHAPGNVPAFAPGANWAIMVYDKTVSWTERKVNVKGGSADAVIKDTDLTVGISSSTTYTKPTEVTVTVTKRERKIRAFIGHGDINQAIDCLESSYLKVLRVF